MERRLTVLLLATGSLGILILKVHGQDEYMTCSRPLMSSRSSRQQYQPPCDTMEHNKDSWCTLPGSSYPWHSVRRFVFENQGLMRRMYGEVRQLSVLRMEFSGESNNLEESRDFGDLFKPITTFDPAMTLSSYTTESIPTLVVTSSIEETKSYFSAENEHSIANQTDDSDLRRSNSQLEENDTLTTIPDMVTTTEGTAALSILEKEGPDSVIVDEPVGSTVEPVHVPTTLETTNDDDDPPVPGEVVALEGNQDASPSPISSSILRNPTSEQYAEKTRNDGGQVLFQDFEKSSTTTTTTEEPRIRTTNRQGVNACPVKEEVVAPYWANNTRGEVLALLNLYPFEQYIHWEKCTNEHRQMYCRDGCRCEQQYRLHRLLAFDPQNECRGIFSDWFRFPSCCVCKCYFDDTIPERLSFNRSPRLYEEGESLLNNLDLDGPDVNGVDDSHFFYKYSTSNSLFRQPRK